MSTLNNVVLFVLVLFVLSVGSVACDFDDNGGGSPTGPSVDDNDGYLRGHPYQGSLPQNRGMSNIFVTGRGGYGAISSVRICVWDHAKIDGDEINLWVGGRMMTYSDGDGVIRLRAESTCWTVSMNTGFYYEIRVLALNEGTDPPNTGSVSVDAGFGSTEESWSVPLRTNGVASIVVEV